MPEKSERERFSASSAARALELACADAGLDSLGAELLRMGENAIYSLPRERVVARIARSASLLDRVALELQIARWLAGCDYPAVRAAADVKQPAEAYGRLVTFWEFVPQTAAAPTVTDLGRLLRALHALPAPPFAVPRFDPFSVVPARLADPGAAPRSDVEFLTDRYRELVGEYQSLEFPTPFGFIHGDAHRGNVLMSPTGPVLSDFEAAAYGPREWDLTPTAMSQDRFGLTPRTYAAFAESYGSDVRGWPGFGVLREIREITMTTWLMQLYEVSERHAAEFHNRVESMREGDHARLWHAA